MMETALVINSVRHLPDKGGFFYGDSSIGPVVGTAEFVSTGVKMYVTGEWKKHSMYGKQFQVKSFLQVESGYWMRLLMAL